MSRLDCKYCGETFEKGMKARRHEIKCPEGPAETAPAPATTAAATAIVKSTLDDILEKSLQKAKDRAWQRAYKKNRLKAQRPTAEGGGSDAQRGHGSGHDTPSMKALLESIDRSRADKNKQGKKGGARRRTRRKSRRRTRRKSRRRTRRKSRRKSRSMR